MNKHDVRTAGEALAYITDCNLATVCDMAGKSKKSKSEFQRQKNIAQQAINWMVSMKIDFSKTRAAEVVKVGSVEAWAALQLPEDRPKKPAKSVKSVKSVKSEE